MKDQILQFIKKRDHVSFIELCKNIPGFEGNLQFVNKGLDNVILWDGVSDEGVNALKHLLSESKIFVKVVEPMVYLHDGLVSLNSYPIATVAKSHKVLHWLPIVFSCNNLLSKSSSRESLAFHGLL